jgi:hypothetical protein
MDSTQPEGIFGQDSGLAVLRNVLGSKTVAERLKDAIGWILAATITLEFVFYFLGLRVVAPFLGIWVAIFLGVFYFAIGKGRSFHWIQFVWLFAMLGLLIATMLSYLDNRVGATFLARWCFGYAAAAFFPLLGGVIDTRWIYGAASILGIQAAIYCAIMMILMNAGINLNYASPIPPVKLFNADYFTVKGFVVTENGERRPVAYTPQAPYAGAIGCFYFLLTLGCRNSLWKWLGMAGWLTLVVLSSARTAQLCTICGLAIFILLAIRRRYLFLLAGVGLIVISVFFQPVLHSAKNAIAKVEDRRSTSTQVRRNLRQLAYDEWEFGNQPFLGTNAVVPGGRVVADMPVGSHDTINSTLMIRGLVGLSLLLTPILLTLVFSFVAGLGVDERICAAIMTALALYVHSESTESLYLFVWPIFLAIGFACRSQALRISRATAR